MTICTNCGEYIGPHDTGAMTVHPHNCIARFDPRRSDIFISRNSDGRPSLEEMWMGMAWLASTRSVCSRLNVGCVITNEEMTNSEAIGYNGKAKGESHDPDSDEPGKSGMIHAEENALIKADFKVKNKKMFVTHSPCMMCARKIVNGDIKELYYSVPYRDAQPLEFLRVRGVHIRQIPKECSAIVHLDE